MPALGLKRGTSLRSRPATRPALSREIWLCRESGLPNHSSVKPAEQTKAIKVARRAGIDLGLLDSNLALTVKERWQQHDAALDLVVKLQEGRKKLDAKLQSAPR